MKKFDKLIILLIGAIALFAGLRNWYFGKIEKEITVDGHQVSLLPCKSGIHDLFGNGVDSIAMCKCLLPKFYELIKDDPDKVDHFKEVGFFKLEGPSNDSAISLFRDCVLSNILDTNYKISISQYFKASMVSKFKGQLDQSIQLDSVQFGNLMKCVFENMDGKITIKEYFADAYSKNGKINTIVNNCLNRVKKRIDFSILFALSLKKEAW